MAKYLVETYYTCSFKVEHYLDNVDENEISKLEKRDDGKFEILDIKLDNRKTKNLEKKSSIEQKQVSNGDRMARVFLPFALSFPPYPRRTTTLQICLLSMAGRSRFLEALAFRQYGVSDGGRRNATTL